jgi:uncharacterized phage-associated protein
MMAERRVTGGSDMASVTDVAAYILRARGPMTAMKLQKLCYYAYGYHLAWEGRRLFPEHFEAWANGPVSPALYRLHRGQLTLQAGDIPGDPDALDPDERESVNLVLDAYGDFSAHELSLLTHREEPWRGARRRARVGPLERSHARLRDPEILEHFEALTAGPDVVAEA